MKIEFIDIDLHEFDKIRAQALIVSAFSHDRPFHGAAGLVDWRMCSRFSRLTLSDFLTSDFGEAVMTPADGRLNVDKVIFVGLGSMDRLDAKQMRVLTVRIAGIIKGLRVNSVIMDMPGSSFITRVGHGERMRMLLQAFRENGLLSEADLKLYIAEKAKFYNKLQYEINRFNPKGSRGRYG